MNNMKHRYHATGTPPPSPLDLPAICPLVSPFPLDGRTEWPVSRDYFSATKAV
jgi:hypothetical protein